MNYPNSDDSVRLPISDDFMGISARALGRLLVGVVVMIAIIAFAVWARGVSDVAQAANANSREARDEAHAANTLAHDAQGTANDADRIAHGAADQARDALGAVQHLDPIVRRHGDQIRRGAARLRRMENLHALEHPPEGNVDMGRGVRRDVADASR